MSKCWYCNNELTTGDSPKHFGICNKCYDGMFKSSDTIIRSFTNKISDLEAKLAEKDAERELDNAFWKQECDSLQKTLAEKEKEILDIKFMMRNTEQALRNVPNAMAGQRKRIDELTKELKQDNQDKISFAITELEKVRKFVVGDCGLEPAEGKTRIEISKYIKQQIALLKGKVEDDR